MIKHIVMWSFKEGEEEKMNEFLSGLKALEGQIPEIKYMEVKKSINEKNEYDAILISKFDNLEDMNKYKVDPRHVKVSELCKSIRTARASIDIEE